MKIFAKKKKQGMHT